MEENKKTKDIVTIRKRIENEPLFTDRKEFFKIFKDYLIDTNIFVKSIGLCSQWGEGKSFFINKLNHELSTEKRSLVFNAWKYDKYKEPLYALIAFINDNQKKFPDYFNSMRKRNDINYQGTFSLNIILATIGITAEKDMNYIIKESLDLNEIFNQIFEQILSSLDYLFIDELDRCNPDFALNIFELFKHFCLDNEGNTKLIFSYDKLAISSIIKTRYGENNLSEIYLKKIIEVEFELPKTDTFGLITEVMCEHLEIENSKLLDKSNYVSLAMLELLKFYNLSTREIIDLMHLLTKKESFSNFTKKDWQANFDDQKLIYISLLLFILMLILKNIEYEKYLSLKKLMDKNILIKEIEINKPYKDIIEKLIKQLFAKTSTINEEDYNNIIYIIFKGSLSQITEEKNDLYETIRKLQVPFSPNQISTFISCETLFNEL